MSNRGHAERLDRHIRDAVKAAKRKGITITLSRFVARLRDRNAALDIPESYILDRLVREANPCYSRQARSGAGGCSVNF